MYFVAFAAFAFWLSQARVFAASDVLTTRDSTPSSYLFVFGDSYTTIGFNASAQPQPSVGNPFGNPPYPGARLSGGDIWIDVVVKNYAKSRTVVYDYANGGDTVNSSRVQSNGPGPSPIADFRGQETEFEMGSGAIPWISSNSLFISWFGINDVAIQIQQGRDLSTSESILHPDVEDYFALQERQYESGARNFITILVPPIYRAPVYGYGEGDNAQNVRDTTQFWNNEVTRGQQNFKNKHSDVNYMIVDPSPTFNYILNHPHQYGAPNSTCLNYPEGQPCLWHDFIHPGIVIQREFGKVMGKAVQQMGF